MSLGNYWLNIKMKKELHKQIEELSMDVWGSDGTLGDLFLMLNDEQKRMLFDMKIRNFESDFDKLGFIFDFSDQ